MKGIMVTLLTFCMTGMVMGQQFKSPNSTSANNSAQSTNTLQSGNPNGMYTSISPEKFKELVAVGLTSPVNGFAVVDEIILFAQGNLPGENIGIIPAESVRKEGNILHLTLDDFDLTTIKSTGLKYKYSRTEIGRFKTVLLHYQAPGARPNNSMASTINPFGRPPQPDDTMKKTYLPAPGPAPGETNYMGPAAPRGFVFDDSKAVRDRSGSLIPHWNSQPNSGNQVASQFDSQKNNSLGGSFRGNQAFQNSPSIRNGSQQNLNSNQSEFAQSNDFGTRRTNQNPTRMIPIQRQTPTPSIYGNQNNQLAGNGTNNNGRFASTNVESFEERQLRETREARLRQAANNEQQRLDIETANIDLEKQKLLNAQNDAYLANQENIRRRKQLERRETVGTNSNGYENNVNDPNGLYRNQYTQKQNQQRQNQIAYNGSMTDYLTDTQINNGAPPTRGGQYPQTGNGVSPMSIPGPNKGAGRSNSGQIGDSRSHNPNNGEANGNQTGILGQTNLNEPQNSTEGIVYFMLLASLGLNLYLGLISRSFYVRYNELADELRETFTATM